jgi:hypothetical protein
MLNKKFIGLGLFIIVGAGMLAFSLSDPTATPLRYFLVFLVSVCYGVGLLNHIKELKN